MQSDAVNERPFVSKEELTREAAKGWVFWRGALLGFASAFVIFELGITGKLLGF